MKSFKDMGYIELVEERDITQTRLDNSKEYNQEWYRAKLRLQAINTEMDRRKNDRKTIK